jgi:hypothetical protein
MPRFSLPMRETEEPLPADVGAGGAAGATLAAEISAPRTPDALRLRAAQAPRAGRALPFILMWPTPDACGCATVGDGAALMLSGHTSVELRRLLTALSRNLGAGRNGAGLAELAVVAAMQMRHGRRSLVGRVDAACLQVASAVYAALGRGEPSGDARTLDDLHALPRAAFLAAEPDPSVARRLLASEWPPATSRPRVPAAPEPVAAIAPTFSSAFEVVAGAVECAKCAMSISPRSRCPACKMQDTGRSLRYSVRAMAVPWAREESSDTSGDDAASSVDI